MKRKALSLAAAAALLLLSACGGSTPASSASHSENWVEATDSPNLQTVEAQGITAVIETSLGEITVILFPEQAPKAVENFTTHAKEGYYDNVSFHRVINDFMIQGGDPTATGSGGKSIWGGMFEDEFSDDLHLYPGALCMANSGADTNGSQFFIVQTDALPDTTAENLMLQWMYNEMEGMLTRASAMGATEGILNDMITRYNNELSDAANNGIPEEYAIRYQSAAERYLELGGTPWLDYKHTVFGQVIKGMNVVDAIAAVETDENNKPLEDVLILSITVTGE